MERRILLQLLAAGFVSEKVAEASHPLVHIAPAQAAAASYKPLFFSAEQMELLEALSEIIIPADDHSGGAAAAMVNRYIDIMVADGSPAAQRIWRDGLERVEKEARSRFGTSFAAASAEQQDRIVAMMARNERAPKTAMERFFSPLKRMTIDGYYTSKIGIHEELEYQGNTAVAEFVGCDHPEHQA